VIALLIAAGIGAGLYFLLGQQKGRSHDIEDEEESDTEMNNENNLNEDDPERDSDDDTYIVGGRDEDDENTENNRNNSEDEPVAPVQDPNAPQALTLTGDADGYPLTLTLEIAANGKVKGSYKNGTDNTTIQVSGTKSGDAIQLTGRANRATYTFRIRPEGHLYIGTLNTSGGKSQELHLTAVR